MRMPDPKPTLDKIDKLLKEEFGIEPEPLTIKAWLKQKLNRLRALFRPKTILR